MSLESRILAERLETVEEIVPLIEPQTLELSFICDVADLETAEAIAASIDHFPILRSCDMRLARRPNKQIQRIAQQVAVRAIGQAPSPTFPFHFMDLPTELRLQILEYTDLIMPLKEVEWNPKDGYYLTYRTRGCERPYEPFWYPRPIADCPPTGNWVPDSDVTGWPVPIPCDQDFYHYSCQFRECWQDAAESGCFCRRYHAAYTTPSSRRQCVC